MIQMIFEQDPQNPVYKNELIENLTEIENRIKEV